MNRYSAERPVGREHIPLYPRGFIALRIVQLVLAVIIIGLCGYGVYGLAFSGDILTLFTALVTLITSIYLLVAEYNAPVIYNYWAILALDIFLVIFWLCSFSLLASQVSLSYSFSYGYYDSYYDSTLAWASCLVGAAGLGGVEFALYVTSLAIHGVMLHRHRMAGLHCNAAHGGIPPSVNYATPAVQNQAQIYQPAPQQVSPAYVGQHMGFVPQQQAFDPARSGASPLQNQTIHTPPPPMQPQNQPYFPRQTPAPLSA